MGPGSVPRREHGGGACSPSRRPALEIDGKQVVHPPPPLPAVPAFRDPRPACGSSRPGEQEATVEAPLCALAEIPTRAGDRP